MQTKKREVLARLSERLHKKTEALYKKQETSISDVVVDDDDA